MAKLAATLSPIGEQSVGLHTYQFVGRFCQICPALVFSFSFCAIFMVLMHSAYRKEKKILLLCKYNLSHSLNAKSKINSSCTLLIFSKENVYKFMNSQ